MFPAGEDNPKNFIKLWAEGLPSVRTDGNVRMAIND